MAPMGVLLYVLLFSLGCSWSWAAPKEELITSLPGLTEPMRSNQYSGFLNISTTKALYYWYVESENDPEKDPLVLWLNGGPGCSSLEGLFVEMGPFRTNDFGATVHRNPWTWNRNASIIYLDAPAGVGFSIRTDDQSNWNYTDEEVANDNLAGMKLWFQKFPERQSNPFFVMGESYGGTYVPMLAVRLIDNNFTLSGVMIGNGCVDDVLNANTLIGFNYNHGFIDERLYQETMNSCCSNYTAAQNCDAYHIFKNNTSDCSQLLGLAITNYNTGLDPYFLYYSCYLNSADQPQNLMKLNYRTAVIRNKFRMLNYDQALPSCTHYNDSTVYLQKQSVRTALHIPDSNPPYESCSDPISNQYDVSKTHVISQSDNVIKIVKAGVKVALFNGDEDSVCNGIHNEQFVANLGFPETVPWQPWNDLQQLPPTIGFITRYKGIDYLTVRGAGHFVSSSQEKPKEAFQMFYNFVYGRDYSTEISEDIPFSSANSHLFIFSLIVAFIVSL